MKKSNLHKFLYLISVLLVLGFAIHTVVDAVRYDSMLTSFPFYVFVIAHAVMYLVPSLFVFIIALIVRNKFTSKEGNEK